MLDLAPAAHLVTAEFAAAPGATVAASFGSLVGAGAAGRATYEARSAQVSIGSVFDLASVTKPFVATTVARLHRLKVLSLDEPLRELFPRAAGTPAGDATLELLLAHRSGLMAHIELYAPVARGKNFDRDQAIQIALTSRRSECVGTIPDGGFPPVYSDMGYLLVGLALEARTGQALDALVASHVLAPLGLEKTMGSARQLSECISSEPFAARVLPTEDIAFRGGVVKGLVHDENAFVMSGDALSGHAGLFGDALSVLAFGQALLDATRDDARAWLGPDDMRRLLRPRPGGSLLAGFDSRAGETPSSGTKLGPRTFGHLGFTGTSLWIDPDFGAPQSSTPCAPQAGFVGVLLSNRVHPTRSHIAIRAARPAVYDAMVTAVVSAAAAAPSLTPNQV